MAPSREGLGGLFLEPKRRFMVAGERERVRYERV